LLLFTSAHSRLLLFVYLTFLQVDLVRSVLLLLTLWALERAAGSVNRGRVSQSISSTTPRAPFKDQEHVLQTDIFPSNPRSHQNRPTKN
jgi:hypothetical protein